MHNPFVRARIILTLWYTAFCMVLIVLMNIGVTAGVNRSVTSPGIPSQEIISINANGTSTATSVDEINKRFGRVLIVIDGVLIAFSALFGYTLSGITLRPIQKNMKEQEEFAQEASHELRTPLSVVAMEIETLKRTEKQIPPQYNAAFKSINEEVRRMSALVDGLLSLVYPDKGGYAKLHKTFGISAAAKQAFLQLQKIANEKHLSYTFSSMYDGNVQGNEEEIKQVILILLDNAIKYSQDGGTVSLTIEKTTDEMLIKISDTGIGISQKDMPHIFDRFYRAKDQASLKDSEGLGLGLAIAQKKVRLHEGRLIVQSKPGRGTTACVYLPLKLS